MRLGYDHLGTRSEPCRIPRHRDDHVDRPHGEESSLLPRDDVGDAFREADEQIVVVQGVGGPSEPGEVVGVLRVVVNRSGAEIVPRWPVLSNT